VSLLQEIQAAVTQDGSDLGSVLLKLRVLAARLGSGPLEEWVKHESEGYPLDAQVPSYRVVPVSYRGTFFGAFGSSINNVQLPGYLIEQFAGPQWTRHEIRDGIAAIDDLARRSARNDGSLGIDASNLILLLQGKVYDGYSCNEVTGTIPRTAISELQYAVRSRILELTLEFEKSVPAASTIAFGPPDSLETADSEKVSQISQNVIFGNVTNISASGVGSQVTVSVGYRDEESLIKHLVKAGLPECDASELANIIANEEPSSREEPLGARAKAWFLENIQKAMNGTWNVGISVATRILTEAALKYYGLK